jgi:hypothetical protein
MRLILIVALLIPCGCATIVSKNHYSVRIESEPEGALVTVRAPGGHEVRKGETPFTVGLYTKGGYFQAKTYSVEAELEGYARASDVVRARLDPWYFGNIVLGGLVGMVFVDPVSGDMWKFDDRHVVLLRRDPSYRAAEDSNEDGAGASGANGFDACFDRCIDLTGSTRAQCREVCGGR